MPEMTPVANQIRPPDPNQTLNTLGGILNLKQQKLALQTGEQELAQKKIETETKQGVQNYFKAFDPLKHTADDGTVDLDSAMGMPEFQNAGNAKPAIMQALLNTKQAQLTAKGSLADLDGELINQFGRQTGALTEDNDVKSDRIDPKTGINPGRVKVKAAIDRFSSLSPEAARVAKIYGAALDHAPQGKLSDALYAQQLQAADVATQRGQQNPEDWQNAAGRHGLRSRRTGALSEAPGGESMGLNPSSPQVTGAAARETGTASVDVNRADQVSAATQPASTAIQLSTEIDSLADQLERPGKLATWVVKRLADAGYSGDPAGVRQLLDKDLGQLKTQAGAAAGSDQRLATILSGYPEGTSTPQTIHTAMDMLRGTFRQNLARSRQLQGYRKTHPDLRGYQNADDILTGTTNPLMHEYSALSTPAAKAAFVKRNFPSREKAMDFLNGVRAAKHHGLLDSGE